MSRNKKTDNIYFQKKAEFQKALACISDLSNHIAQKEAHSELTKMKDANPTLFSDVRFYLAVHDLLARFSYELPVVSRIF